MRWSRARNFSKNANFLPDEFSGVKRSEAKLAQLFRHISKQYRGADKSLARPPSRCILSDGENISFDASLVIYIYK